MFCIELRAEVKHLKARLATEEENASTERERHDALRISVTPILERFKLTDHMDSEESFVPVVDSLVERVHQVAIESLRFGVRQAFAVGRIHYSNIASRRSVA